MEKPSSLFKKLDFQVQAHCMLIIFAEEDFSIYAVSENVPLFFYRHINDVLGQSLLSLLDTQRVDYIKQVLQASDLEHISPMKFVIEREGNSFLFYLKLRRQGKYVSLEFKRQPNTERTKPIDPYGILNMAISKMQAAQAKEEIYQLAVRKLQIIGSFDRVNLFEFKSGNEARVLAEENNGQLPSLEGVSIVNDYFVTSVLDILANRSAYYVVDLRRDSVNMFGFEGVEPLLTDIHTLQSVGICQAYKSFFSNQDIGSILLVMVSVDESTSKIMVGWNKQEKYISYEQRKSCELLSQMLSSQLILKEAQEEKYYATQKGNILNSLLESISSKSSFIEGIQEKNEQFLSLCDAEGAAIYLGTGQHYAFGRVPSLKVMETIFHWLDEQEEEVRHVHSIPDDLMQKIGKEVNFCGFWVASLSQQRNQYMIWFRDHQLTERSFLDLETNQIKKEVQRQQSGKWDSTVLYYLGELRKIIVESLLRTVQEEEEQNAKFRYMFQNSSDIIMLFEEDLNVRYISDSAEHILGYDMERIKCCWQHCIHPEDKQKVRDVLEQIREVKEGKRLLEFRLQHANGEYLYVETVFQNLLDKENIKAILSNTRNITHRIENRKRLKKFEVAIESSTNGVLFIEKDERNSYPVIYMNCRYKELTGRTRDETLNRPCMLFQYDGVNDIEIKKLRTALYSNERAEVFLQKKRKSGEPYWCNVQIYPVQNKEEEVSNYIALITDTTYQKQAEQQLKEYAKKLYISNEELQTFAYVASHDLQEPLRTIAGFSELLAEIYKGQLDDEADEYIDFILQATNRMKRLIHDLLLISRVSTGNTEVTSVDLNKVLESSIENLHSAIENTQTQIIKKQELPVVQINETMVSQVFQNIISNAIKYRHQGRTPQITINCQDKDMFWEISIADNGIGIQSKYYDRIFVIFQRLHTNEDYSGTGIGLAICKRIIDKYGGRIWVESEEGKGSVFYFTIPKNFTSSKL